MHVLLSIKPQHVAKILEGEKTFEFRRRIFARRDVTKVIIYCTRPVGRLVGEFDIADIIQAGPDELWLKTSHGSGITKSYFDDYFAGRIQAFAIRIGKVKEYSHHIIPRDLVANFTPPQSYMYIRKDGSRLSENLYDQMMLI